MNETLAVVGVFAVLLAPFFVFLAILRFISPEKRWRPIVARLRQDAPPSKLSLLVEFLAGLF